MASVQKKGGGGKTSLAGNTIGEINIGVDSLHLLLSLIDPKPKDHLPHSPNTRLPEVIRSSLPDSHFLIPSIFKNSNHFAKKLFCIM